jgi:16S rRNA (adenine1518-N6/adenine1519-N6)-dimethyltransferase
MPGPKKSLGQHWLHDRDMLMAIAEYAELTKDDTVLEIGPGLGTLTSELLRQAGSVVAVEFDANLARKLPGQFPGKQLRVVYSDILSFDLSTLPVGYKVVANVPYYITSKIVQLLMTAKNKPSVVVLLVQKEVAERLAASAGSMSILAVSAQVFADVSLGDTIPARLFTPPPKVDSAPVIMRTFQAPRFGNLPEKDFFTIVRAGFSAPRKKLKSSLAGGLGMTREAAETLLVAGAIPPESRAQALSIDDWVRLARAFVAKT